MKTATSLIPIAESSVYPPQLAERRRRLALHDPALSRITQHAHQRFSLSRLPPIPSGQVVDCMHGHGDTMDRPDIAARVFHMKQRQLLEEVRGKCNRPATKR